MQTTKLSNKTDAKTLCSLILRTRRLNKMLSTYYIRLSEQIYDDGMIRPYYVHVATQTGRLVSDIQQVPKSKVSKVKAMFVTRWEKL